MANEASPCITLVTVTYADRLHFLFDALRRSLDEEGVTDAVIVSNGSRSDLSILKERWGDRVTIVELGANTGSAAGYAAGIEAALNNGAEFLWLMDDDNAPAKGATKILIEELVRLRREIGRENAAVLGLRGARSAHLRNGANAFPRESSFVGFHLSDVPLKIMKRLRFVRGASVKSGCALYLPYSPYGGLMAGREVFERLGLPKRDFVLYADDWEYTLRLTKTGGTIKLVPEAPVQDLEQSWFECDRSENIFFVSLMQGSDLRVFYSFRNHVWLNRFKLSSSPVLYKINKWSFLSILFCYALAYGKMARLSLILRAIGNAERDKLGIDPKFTLS